MSTCQVDHLGRLGAGDRVAWAEDRAVAGHYGPVEGGLHVAVEGVCDEHIGEVRAARCVDGPGEGSDYDLAALAAGHVVVRAEVEAVGPAAIPRDHAV